MWGVRVCTHHVSNPTDASVYYILSDVQSGEERKRKYVSLLSFQTITICVLSHRKTSVKRHVVRHAVTVPHGRGH